MVIWLPFGIQETSVIKSVVILIGLAIFSSGATFGRYGNFDPCDWTAQDHAKATLVPRIVWAGRLKADFLLRGVAQPSFSDCMFAWWESRAKDAAEEAIDKIRN
jgi:hypothetical protein